MAAWALAERQSALRNLDDDAYVFWTRLQGLLWQ